MPRSVVDLAPLSDAPAAALVTREGAVARAEQDGVALVAAAREIREAEEDR